MIITELLKYLDNLINNDDDYAMEVLYYHLRKKFAKNGYTLNGIQSIEISKKYHESHVTVKLFHNYSSIQESIALLLTIRGIMLDHDLIDYCDKEVLFFQPKCHQAFGWVKFTTTILNHQDDDDFDALFRMLEEVEYNDELSEETQKQFIESTKIPPCKNIENYYREIAESEKVKSKIVIPNNYYLGNDEVTELSIPQEIEYIGNTAFAYCTNLKKIVFNRDNLIFGKFPIIECKQLKVIIVPKGSEVYYKKQLPYYENIIFNIDECPKDDVVETYISKGDICNKSTQVNESVCPTVLESKRIQEIETQHKSIDIETPQPPTILLNSEKTTVKKRLPSSPKDSESNDFKIIYSVFKNKSTSYKYFWLLSILEIAKERQYLSISYKEILPRMISLAWPLITDRINFGPLDKIHDIAQSLILTMNISINSSKSKIDKILNEKYDNDNVNRILVTLTKNVPYRFLSPWIKYTTDKEVMRISRDKDCNAPYALYEDYIILDESWFEYLTENYEDLHTFIRKSLLDYLKKYNNDFSLLRYMIED